VIPGTKIIKKIKPLVVEIVSPFSLKLNILDDLLLWMNLKTIKIHDAKIENKIIASKDFVE
tara:strand:+ start:354 stop:536 length:183 start_codon:yes stop_codon:yes gene_type:complete